MKFGSPYRRTIAEVVALYELEPELRVVYVEGPRDRALIATALASLGHGHIGVYEIETVEVSADAVDRANEDLGAKGRLVALAAELERIASNSLQTTVVCLVDSDCDRIRGCLLDLSLLVYTSGVSLEAGILGKHILDRYIDLVLLGLPVGGEELLSRLLPLLRRLFLVRVAVEELGIHAPRLALGRLLQIRDDAIELDWEEYAWRMLNVVGEGKQRLALLETAQRFEETLGEDPGQFIQADDFFESVYLVLRRYKSRHVPKLEHFREHLMALVRDEDLVKLWEVEEIVSRLVRLD